MRRLASGKPRIGRSVFVLSLPDAHVGTKIVIESELWRENVAVHPCNGIR